MNTLYPKASHLRNCYIKKKSQLLWTKVNTDLETPVSAYLKFCVKQKNSFLLESVQDGTFRGRYSIIGMDPDIIWKCIRNKAYIKNFNSKNKSFILLKKKTF